jgi:hypothetical protein
MNPIAAKNHGAAINIKTRPSGIQIAARTPAGIDGKSHRIKFRKRITARNPQNEFTTAR